MLASLYADGEGVEQDHAKAARLYKLAAEQGYASGQFNLGVCYEYGTGVEQDDVEAVRWYQAAAEQGYADAQCSLGFCYRNGTGVEHDDMEAVRWYRAAAEQGYAVAQFNLGAMHYNWKGIVDYAAAAKWWKLAATQGHANAIKSLTLALTRLFPPGTAVELVGLKAASFNGKRGVVVEGDAAVGRLVVLLDGHAKAKSFSFANLQAVLAGE
jgi:TPR repeat protein